MTYPIELESGNVVRFAGDLTFTGAQPSGQSTSALTGMQYVTTSGNDANDGYSWATAKLTIQAAIEALPYADDGIAKNGIVEIGYGRFDVASGTDRTDTGCSVTTGSAVIVDANAVLGDVGALLDPVATGLPAGARVISAIEGVSLTMDRPATQTKSLDITVRKAAIKLYPGVKLRGRGRMNGYQSGNSTNYPTQIADSGTGVTIMPPVGSGPGNSGTSQSVTGCDLENISVIGNANNSYGFYAADIWGIVIRGCEFRRHGKWGIFLYANAAVHGVIEDSECRDNGTAGSSAATGGLFIQGSPSIFTITNFRSMFNYGFAVQCGMGCSFIGCELQYTIATSFTNSGGGLLASGGAGNGTIMLAHCWLEGNASYQVGSSAPALVLLSCMFQGGGTTPFAVSIGADTQQIVIDGCYSQGHTSAMVKFTTSGSPGSFSWRASTTVDPVFCKSFSGSASDLAAALSQGQGTRNMAVLMVGLPTSDPLVNGQVWANSGVLTVSAG